MCNCPMVSQIRPDELQLAATDGPVPEDSPEAAALAAAAVAEAWTVDLYQN